MPLYCIRSALVESQIFSLMRKTLSLYPLAICYIAIDSSSMFSHYFHGEFPHFFWYHPANISNIVRHIMVCPEMGFLAVLAMLIEKLVITVKLEDTLF